MVNEYCLSYKLLSKVGAGAFGEVYKAIKVYRKVSDSSVLPCSNREVQSSFRHHVEMGDDVEEWEENETLYAIKTIRIDTNSPHLSNVAFREIKAMQELHHPNVVQLHEVVPRGSEIALVMEYMEVSLEQILQRSMQRLSDVHIKTWMQMLLRGIAYCHARKIMHRDLKPANVLLRHDGVLKIGDFGQACADLGPEGTYSHQIATRWYRSPEILYGARQYSASVDLWAVGTIFAELLNHSVLFRGESDIDQLFQVIQVLGNPEASWPEVMQLPDFHKISFPAFEALPMTTVAPNASPSARDLLAQLLMYDPSQRISAQDALCHPYFFERPLATRELKPLVYEEEHGMKWTKHVKKSEDVDELLQLPADFPSVRIM